MVPPTDTPADPLFHHKAELLAIAGLAVADIARELGVTRTAAAKSFGRRRPSARVRAALVVLLERAAADMEQRSQTLRAVLRQAGDVQ